MGNHHSHGVHSSHKPAGSTASSTSPEGGEPAASVEPTHTTQLKPLEKLAKILTEKSQQEDNVNGISLNVFNRYLFPRYPIFAEKFYAFLLSSAKVKTQFMSTTSFKQQCERYLSVIDDNTHRDLLVKMFSSLCYDDNEMITPEGLKELLMCAYHISMDHYSEGPQMCWSISKTLKSIVDSCFHQKTSLSVQFVSHWLGTNTPRLLLPLHRYAIHSLATSWRTLEQSEPSLAAGLELATPVLEQPPPFVSGKAPHPHLLNMSFSWLLAGALPPLYSWPQRAHSPNNSGVALASMAFLSKILCSVPSHWAILYDSDEMGLGANRFLHHVMSYKGPTLTLLKVQGGEQLFCIASPCEWKETHLFWGGEESALYQLLPKFSLLEKGSKMLYLNLSVRGYPQGLRVGQDPRATILNIDSGFEKLEFKKIPYKLDCVEVWGCGDQVSRERQLEIKKWEVKEVERQRCVKLTADDWLDHPDRYLLELAGRPQYHQNQN